MYCIYINVCSYKIYLKNMRDKYSEDLSALITTIEDMIDRWGVKLIATPIINYLLFRLSAEKKGKIKADGRDN